MLLMQHLFKIKNWQLYLVLCLMMLIIVYLTNLRMFNLEVFDNLLGNQMSTEQVETIFNSQKDFQWMNYLIVPVIFLLKTTFSAFFIHMILIFADYDVSYKNIFKLNLLTSASFVLSSIVQVIRLYTLEHESITEANLQAGTFSLAFFFEKENTLMPLYSLFMNINPYEILYLTILIFGVQYLSEVKMKKALVTSLLIWGLLTLFIVLIQSFLILNMK